VITPKSQRKEPEINRPEITRERCNEAGQLVNLCLQPTKEECATFQKLSNKLLRNESLHISDFSEQGGEQMIGKIMVAIATMTCIIYAGSRGHRADPNAMYWWLRAWSREKVLQCINSENEAIKEVEIAEHCKTDTELWSGSIQSTKQEHRQLCLIALTGQNLPKGFVRGIKLLPGGIPKEEWQTKRK
jgi:hypothetical protein